MNGFLLQEDSAKGLADKILEYVSLPENAKEQFLVESIKLTQTVHTYTNFKTQMENIWDKVLNAN